MVTKKNALIFGYNEYAKEIKKSISSIYESIEIFSLGVSDEHNFDLSDDWSFLEKRYKMEDSISFCVLEDIAENIFLTISLRDAFSNMPIVAFAKDKESAAKLELAGASRVIPLTQTTANIISEMLEKPIITDVLHNIFYEKSDLQIAQVNISSDHDLELAYSYDLLILFIVRQDLSKEFIYSSKALHHGIDKNDFIIVVGMANNIIAYEKRLGVKDV
ncbi:MAG: potassium transporter TrkA [Campylobacterales bacterium]|nr:potassium transporter TrkA [Campylobacterales bacterium]